MQKREYRQCTRCVMDTSAHEIEFDEKGVCNFCRRAEKLYSEQVFVGEEGERRRETQFERIKAEGKGQRYDALIGLSGGVDSSYAALVGAKAGLRLVAVHCDTGWNSDIAIKNIKNICETLNLDLITVVVDWEEMRSAQAAFFHASVPNCDIPQDHAIVAVNNQIAAKHGIKNFLSGGNLASESILPYSWVYDARDWRHLKAVHRKFGSGRLRQFPRLSAIQSYIYLPYIRGVKNYRVLNDLDYRKDDVKEVIKSELQWQDYGGKHHESVFTKFFQAHYLPEKFGFDKRRAHFSSMIVSGQMTRAEAEEQLKLPLYDPDKLAEDRKFFIKKLKLSEADWETIMTTEPKRHQDYPNSERIARWRRALKNRIEGSGIRLRRSW